ncbi:hypothetical protein IKE86_01640 [Candidatus Saccharibacteria bacterium]|nr:hypothetical protein [Candidatus Saccharibacteria bacterium]
MYRLSKIIEELYQKYFLKAEKRGVRFNLDFPDVTRRIDRPSVVRKPLDLFVDGAIGRAEKEVSLSVAKDAVIVRDDGVALSPATVAEMSSEFDNIRVRSRVGFGTEVKILL